jgi:hypothetical protein
VFFQPIVLYSYEQQQITKYSLHHSTTSSDHEFSVLCLIPLKKAYLKIFVGIFGKPISLVETVKHSGVIEILTLILFQPTLPYFNHQ